MLASIPPKGDRALESFRMFLALRSKEDAYSLSLFDYFSHTLRVAKIVLDDPSAISKETPPDVISLAVQLLKDQLLREVFDKIDISKGPTREQAGIALRAMEGSVAFNSQPAHFAAGIRVAC